MHSLGKTLLVNVGNAEVRNRRCCTVLRFDPLELEEEVKTALQGIAGSIDDAEFAFLEDGFNPLEEGFDPAEFEDITITEDSKLKIGLPQCDDSIEITYGELIALADELANAKLVENVEYWAPTRFLLRVAPIAPHSSLKLIEHLYAGSSFAEGICITETVVGPCKCECSLVSGYSPFAFLITGRACWDKYYPPVLPDDLFIQVCFDKGASPALVREIASAYQFELGATLSLYLERSPRADEIDNMWEGAEANDWSPPPLRPLLIGAGLPPLLQLSNKAVANVDAEVCVLYLTKCFEYVAQTVVRQQLVETMRAKLMSPRALNPSADFIIEIESLLEELRNFRRDREAVILTAVHCCEATELAPHAPPFLTALAKVNGKTKRKEREEALKHFAASLIATRNSIAHAKANYEPTGEECPDAQLGLFAECARIAAQQVIRWYADRSESSRVT